MAIPQLLSDVVRVLLLLAPSAALLSLVLAGISLRREGGNTFIIGGGFTKWMFWAVVFDTPIAPGLVQHLWSGCAATGWRHWHSLARILPDGRRKLHVEFCDGAACPYTGGLFCIESGPGRRWGRTPFPVHPYGNVPAGNASNVHSYPKL